MLDAFVIEEIKRQERERSRDDDRPVVQLPIPEPRPPHHDDHGEEPGGGGGTGGGVVIIDYTASG